MNEFSLKETKRIIGLIENAVGSLNTDVENIQKQIDELEEIRKGFIEKYGETPSDGEFWGLQGLVDYIDTAITRFNQGIKDYTRQMSCDHDNIIFNQPFQDERGNAIYKTYCKDCGMVVEQKNQNGQLI